MKQTKLFDGSPIKLTKTLYPLRLCIVEESNVTIPKIICDKQLIYPKIDLYVLLIFVKLQEKMMERP